MIYKSLFAAAALGTTFTVAAPDAEAYGDRFLGEIITVGYTFCPRGTAPANGQLLPIMSNQALFSLLGTTYGGDGRTTFGLPDLRGRTMIGEGTGAGLSSRRQGERGGVEQDAAGPAPANVEEPNVSASTSSGNNMQPYLVLRHCVVMEGIFPSRS